MEDEKSPSDSLKQSPQPAYRADNTANVDPEAPPLPHEDQKSLTKDTQQLLVKFDSGDAEDPHNFHALYKAYLTLLLGLLALVGSFGSSVIAPAEPVIAQRTGTSLVVASLVISLFVLGWALGPLIWAPLGEVYGRKWGMLPGLFVLGLFSIGTATSNNAASIFVTRFLGGIFASAPISNVPASLGDLYTPQQRGTAMAFVSMCITGGPTIAPLVGAACTVNRHLGWRWTVYVEAIFAFAMFAVALLTLPETYAPVLLKRKAIRLRKETGNDGYYHPHEKEKINPRNVFTKYLSRPARMFLFDPMVTCITLYASFTYSLIYMTLQVFPIVFNEQRGYSTVVSTLPFLGILVGVAFALIINFGNNPLYARAVEKNNGRPVPEARLPPMVIGGVFLTAGLFWFGWTAAPRYSWVLPTFGGGFIGAGFSIVFQQCLNFLVDTYGPLAGSAVAANTILRSFIAGGLPVAARPMFENLGVAPASSLLGGISCLALPVPFIFMKYGAVLRKKSEFAVSN